MRWMGKKRSFYRTYGSLLYSIQHEMEVLILDTCSLLFSHPIDATERKKKTERTFDCFQGLYVSSMEKDQTSQLPNCFKFGYHFFFLRIIYKIVIYSIYLPSNDMNIFDRNFSYLKPRYKYHTKIINDFGWSEKEYNRKRQENKNEYDEVIIDNFNWYI